MILRQLCLPFSLRSQRLGSALRINKLPARKLSSFTYEALSSEENIRLLKVTVGTGGRLTCMLEEHCLSFAIQPKEVPTRYAALSYTWSNTLQTEIITCNDMPMHITKNLADALRGTLSLNPYDHIWVDQICINQADNIEKSAQVTRMTRIYHVARLVLAWLGPQRHDTELAVEWIEKVASLTKGYGNDIFREYENYEERIKIETWEEISIEESCKLGVDFSNEAAWAAFSAFYDWPWYERVWIVQELLPAREARLVCGNSSVDWHAVKAAAAWYIFKADLVRKSLDQTRKIDGITLTNQMNLPWTAVWGSEFYPEMYSQTVRPTFLWWLPSLLKNFGRRIATDPRDKVYALVGICTDFHQQDEIPLLRPDYNKSTIAAFRDMVQGHLQAQSEFINQDLNIIWDAALCSETPERPSWVPDLREDPASTQHGGWLPRDNPASSKNYHLYRYPPTENHLIVEGIILGIVVRQSEWQCSGPLTQNIRASRDEFVSLYESMFASRNYIHSMDGEEGIDTAFTMSLTAGQMWSGFQERNTSEPVLANHFVDMWETLYLPQKTLEEYEHRFERSKPFFEIGLADSGNEWAQFFWSRYCGKRWYITDTGYVGIASQRMRPGDVIAIVWGLDRACVLRPVSENELSEDEALPEYKLIGEAYCRYAERAIEVLPKDDYDRSEGTVFALC